MDDHVPTIVRVHLAHAVVQGVADDCGADILHVKGPAVDPRVSDRRRPSTDADVVVRPAHVKALMAGLAARGWDTRTTFSTGSAFEHAASLWHDQLGWVDVHRFFPGFELDAAEAFDVLWRDSSPATIAHRPCRVPSLDAQRLLLLVHAARSHRPLDVEAAWGSNRDATMALARVLRAEVALAAATGSLDDYADEPTYQLWRHFSTGGTSRLAEWRARIKAAPTKRAAALLAARALLVNTDHLAMRLGHRPTRREVVDEYGQRIRAAVREGVALVRRRRR
ncbi:MAG TPA: 2-nitropropane dioxygenase [Propionibacteriaceae bacterium]|nr:2-nitropropane dioxygenase [Propionibacteriaceae bacterium]